MPFYNQKVASRQKGGNRFVRAGKSYKEFRVWNADRRWGEGGTFSNEEPRVTSYPLHGGYGEGDVFHDVGDPQKPRNLPTAEWPLNREFIEV